MIKGIFYFLLVSIGAGLVQMKIPLFGRHSKRWEEQNYAQRFGGIFFPTFIALVVIFLFNEYKTAQLPTLNEEMLMNGAEYCLATSIPASIILVRTSSCSLAGPIVQIIFVLRIDIPPSADYPISFS